MINITKARELFPYLKQGTIYFNHASSGPLSTPVVEALNKVLIEKSETNIDDYMSLLAVIKETKSDLASMINAFPDRIAFVDNTTNGINILASGLKLNPGDHILLNDVEFPANVYPFINLQKNGIIIDFVKSHNGIVTAEDVIERIVPETKLIAISQVQFLSGYRVNLEKIGSVCKEKGIFFAVDAIQGLGAVRLDVVKDNIDFIAGGTQKWLLGLQGMAYVYVSERLQEEIDQKYAGWLSVDDAWDFLNYNLKLKKSAERYQGGTLNTLGIYAFNASLKLFKQYGFSEIESHVIDNTLYFLEKLRSTRYQPVLKEIDKTNIAGIVSFIDDNWKTIYDEMTKANIICSVRLKYIRFSPHFYNTKEEIDKVIGILKKIG